MRPARIGTEQWLAGIAARAAPLWERRPLSGEATSGARGALGKWSRWVNVLGSEDILSSRLVNAGLERKQLDSLLAGEQQTGQSPTWVATFRTIFLTGEWPASRKASDRAVDPDAPLPFEDLLIGAVRHARTEAATRSANVAAVLCPSAAAILEHQLLAHLTFVASSALGREFYEFRFRRAPLSAFEDLFSEQPKTTCIYDVFAAKMQRGGLLRLFDRYPVVARLVARAVEQWVLNTVMLCDRYVADFDFLETMLDADLHPVAGSIIDVRTDLSDRHHEGATAVALSLRSGHRLVYKPRSGGGELGWAAVLAWLNGRNPGCTLKAPGVLDRGSYHWNINVPVAACATQDDVHRFYVRCGVTMAALHVLSATDIHCENLIASGDHPILVDLEMLLNPGAAGDSGHLVRTGMLPNWQTAPTGYCFDMSALGADHEQDHGVAIPGWRNINTDQMTRVTSTVNRPTVDHRVRLGNVWPTALDYIDALLNGFVAGYRCFLQGRDELCADPDIRSALTGMELRVLVRDSATYARLLLYLLQPDLLRDGLDRSIEIEWLARPLGVALRWPAARLSVYEIERQAIEAQDIPHLTTSVWNAVTQPSEDPDLQALGNGRVPETLYQRLATLSEADLQEHLAVIEEAVRQRFGADAQQVGPGRTEGRRDLSSQSPATSKTLLRLSQSAKRDIRSSWRDTVPPSLTELDTVSRRNRDQRP